MLMLEITTARDVYSFPALTASTETPLKLFAIGARRTTLEWLTTARNHARYSNEAGHYDDVLAFLKRHGKA